jgi:predicted membrane-bound mannosyltransferase
VVNLARTEASALLVAVLWTVHPIHNAAVAYISGRADSLASLFALSAWLLIERVPNERRKWRPPALFVLAGVAMLLALSSKEIALVWLLIFLVYLLFFEQPRSRRAKTVLIAGDCDRFRDLLLAAFATTVSYADGGCAVGTPVLRAAC